MIHKSKYNHRLYTQKTLTLKGLCIYCIYCILKHKDIMYI